MTIDPALTPWPHEDAVDRWAALHADVDRGSAAYHQLLATHRVLQDRLAAATPPPEVADRLSAMLRDVSDLLAEHQAPEANRWDGWQFDQPGRGMPVLPPFVVDDSDDSSLRGRVTFGRFYLGGNGAAHGGTPPLLFDDVMGRLANHGYPGVARTAFLKVNYRRITPIDVELTFEVTRDLVEGRKRWVSGRLYNPAGEIACDAQGLFLQLLPGQQ
ncbi:MAG: PaaI family thioesterase [Jatrophihabitantaceae bacterium]